MFTPPASPKPRPTIIIRDPESLKNPAAPSPCTPSVTSPNSARRIPDKVASNQRLKWTVLLLPLALIVITASTRYFTHPEAFHLFAAKPSSWKNLMLEGTSWSLHKRHPDPNPQASTPSFPTGATSATSASSSAPSSSSSSTPTSGATQTVPTVPAVAPTLPTPFPQPFDGDVTQNYSAVSCYNFFTNMTGSTAFRSCRPLSFLSQSSDDFLNAQAQANLTLLNNLIWGTCNTKTDAAQCQSNMDWFADNLQTACAADLKANNDMVTSTLTALKAYTVVRTTGCLTDPTSNTYCYLNAAHNTNPADLYFYNLPLGIPLPSSTNKLTLLCSACTKSVMNTYVSALEDSSQKTKLSALAQTYPAAASLTNQQCGATFVTSLSNGAAPISWPKLDMAWWLGLVLLPSLIGLL